MFQIQSTGFLVYDKGQFRVEPAYCPKTTETVTLVRISGSEGLDGYEKESIAPNFSHISMPSNCWKHILYTLYDVEPAQPFTIHLTAVS